MGLEPEASLEKRSALNSGQVRTIVTDLIRLTLPLTIILTRNACD